MPIKNTVRCLLLVLIVCQVIVVDGAEGVEKKLIPSYVQQSLGDVVWSTRAEDQVRLALAEQVRETDPDHPVLALEALVSARRRGDYRAAMDIGVDFFDQIPDGVDKDELQRAICGDALRANAAADLAQVHQEWVYSLLISAGMAADLEQIRAILGQSSDDEHWTVTEFRVCMLIIQQQWADAVKLAKDHNVGQSCHEMVAILAVDDQNTCWKNDPGLASFVLLHAEALGNLSLADEIMDAGIIPDHQRRTVGYLSATLRRDGRAAMLELAQGDNMSWMPTVILRGRQNQDVELWKQLPEDDRRMIVNLWAEMGCVKDYEWGRRQIIDTENIYPIFDDPTHEEVLEWYAPNGRYFNRGGYAAEALRFLLHAKAYDIIEPWLIQGLNDPNGEYLLWNFMDDEAWQPFFSLASTQLNAHPLWRIHRARLFMARGDLAEAQRWSQGLDPSDTDSCAMARLTIWGNLPSAEDPVKLLDWATANRFPVPVESEAQSMRRWITHEFADDERREQFLAQVIVWFDQTQVGLNRCGLYPIGGKRGTSYTVAAWARGDNAAAVGLDVLVCFAQDVDGYGWGDFTYAAYASWAAVCGRDQAMARALIHRECDPREITMTRIHNLPFVSDALRRASPELQRKWAAPSKK